MNETIKEIQLIFGAASKFVRPIVIGMVQALLGILILALIAGVVLWVMWPVPSTAGPIGCLIFSFVAAVVLGLLAALIIK
jgi:hypothetical protein